MRLVNFSKVRLLSTGPIGESSSDSGSAEIWDWVPPANQVKRKDETNNYVIPTIEG